MKTKQISAPSGATESPPVAQSPAEIPHTPAGAWGAEAAGGDNSYDNFILTKSRKVPLCGFEPREIKSPMFPFQKHTTQWAIRKGRSALFEECGLGKTLQSLEWAQQVADHIQMPVIILTPLAVARQTLSESIKFGYDARVVAAADEVRPGINITNYEKIDLFDGVEFGGVVLDESSILKNFNGKTRRKLTDRFSQTPYRLCCTATPSPNDYSEFGQHADFLGICSPAQMLATFFVNDTFNTGDWRLKKHAETQFWEWVASWAACIGKPSDIGYSDEGYELPALNLETITVDVDEVAHEGSEELFKHSTLSATTMHKELRETAADRANAVSDMVNASDESWIVWCNTNLESEMLREAINGSVEVKGADSAKFKESAALWFCGNDLDEDQRKCLSSGYAKYERVKSHSKHLSGVAGEPVNDPERIFDETSKRVLISKSGIFGYGMNWQHCRNVAFVGLSYSFEDFYQALRRSYRFGQTREVNAYIVQARTEGAILATVKRKMEQHSEMQSQMKIASASFKNQSKQLVHMKTDINSVSGDGWEIHHGDCVRVAQEKIADNSIDLAIFSPPFADLFTYSDDLQDMGNCSGLEEFADHFKILIAEIARVMKPGRNVAVHCVDLLSTMSKHGKIEFQDFSGEIIRMFWKHDFAFHSRICIWKSPVTEMQRTKAHGLLYKTLKSDSSRSRVGCADYLLVFKAPGVNETPITKDPNKYSVDWWQEVASPVWMTVDQGRVLNKNGSKDNKDEKHICPLQIDVIERTVELWSNPGELIYSPFTGIGSEGVGSVELDRKFIGSELKESYFNQAVQNLRNAKAQLSLFS